MRIQRSGLAAIWGTIVMLGVAAGCRGDVQRCEQACRNFGNLVEWKTSQAEVAAAPADQRDALRKHKAAELDRHVDVCVSKCVSGNDPDAVACLIAAKTSEQALACAK